MWFNFCTEYIADDDFVKSADELGIDPTSYGDRLEEARSYEWFRPDLVWVFESSSDDPRDHIGLAEWATKDKYIYEVDPIGDLIEDPVPLV